MNTNQPWIDEDGNVSISKLYVHMRENYHILTVNNGKENTLYYFDNGCYKPLSEDRCKGLIKTHLPVEIRKSSHWNGVYKELITDLAKVEESDFNSDESIINFQNGILDIYTDALMPHDPKYLSTIQIPCDYVPGLRFSSAPTFKKFLDDLTCNPKDLVTLLESIGLIISNVIGSRFKKLLVLKGPGNTGKSVLREFVTYLVGDKNSQSIDIKKLHSRFGVSEIYGKRLAGSGDLAFSRLDEIDKIKELTGGDNINVEAKYKQGFQFKYRGLLWYNCNELPLFGGDKGKHVYERFIIISCDKPVPEEERDSDLLNKLKEEKEAVISLAVKFLQSAIKKGYKFTESEKVIANREEYITANNSLIAFVNECCDICKHKTPTGDFNRKYQQWCSDNGLRPEKKHSIKTILEETFGVTAQKSGVWYYELRITINEFLSSLGKM